MKILVILSCFLVTACTTKTQYGSCVGLNGGEDPKLEYKYSAWNLGMGIGFFGLIIPPIVVVLDELKCPVGVKP